jgi:hypothetical protein
MLRRTVSIILVITGLFTIITGIWNFFPPFNESFSPGHAFGACIFSSLCIIHAWLNWKSIRSYLKGLGWKALLFASGLLVIVVVGIFPLLRR